jgi:membrane-bound metal-dependent hydrolase YbcI (DUF457 family)
MLLYYSWLDARRTSDGRDRATSHESRVRELDNVTHTLVAITLARTPLARAGRGTTAALVIASNVPDVDIIATAGGSLNYLKWHRGPTHGPLGLVGLGVLVAALVWLGCRMLDRRRGRASDAPANSPLPMLVAISMIGILVHVLMDLPTSYGTRLLSPFDWHWYAVDWMPIIDVYLLMVLVAGMGFGRNSPEMRRRKAAIVLAFMAANYGVRAVAHHQALALAPRLFGPTLPPRCAPQADTAPLVDRWPRPQPSLTAPSASSAGRCLVEIAAMPTFTSPFRWRIVAQMSNAYEIHEIDLLDGRFRKPESDSDVFWRLTLRYPNLWTTAVEKAATTVTGRTFLGFSRFPAARTAADREGGATVRWSDMRFVGGVLAFDQPLSRPGPFTVTIRIGPDGRILSETLGVR